MSAKSLIFAIFALSSPFVVLSDELDAVSDNYYSILKVDAQSKETAIAVPFVAIAAATNQQPISVAEAVDTRSLSEGDMLMIYDHVKERYNSYQVNANDTWEAVRMVTRTSEGEVEQDDGEVASKMKVAPGYGSWLIRKNTANSIVLHGQIPYSVKIEVKTGKNLIGSTTLDQTDFNNCSINWSENGVEPTTFERVNNVLTYDFGDSIMFTPPGGTESRVIYYVKVGDAEPKWRSIGKKVVTVLPTGCACWLIHKGSGFSYDTYALEDDQQEGDQSTEQEQEGEGNE